jgi:hypothetical protein
MLTSLPPLPPPPLSLVTQQEKPTDLAGKQAMAAIGMVRLMRMYDDFFTSVSQPIAQVLVSLDNLMVGLYKLKQLTLGNLKGAWFQPLNLKCDLLQ